jgi:hypothetical protein
MANEILKLRFFPCFHGRFGFHTVTVENDREKASENAFVSPPFTL